LSKKDIILLAASSRLAKFSSQPKETQTRMVNFTVPHTSAAISGCDETKVSAMVEKS